MEQSHEWKGYDDGLIPMNARITMGNNAVCGCGNADAGCSLVSSIQARASNCRLRIAMCHKSGHSTAVGIAANKQG